MQILRIWHKLINFHSIFLKLYTKAQIENIFNIVHFNNFIQLADSRISVFYVSRLLLGIWLDHCSQTSSYCGNQQPNW